MRQLELFAPPPESVPPSLVPEAEATPGDPVPLTPAPDPRHQQPGAGEGVTLPLRPASEEFWVMYAPVDPGDDLAATLRRALAAFRERRGSSPPAVAAHPSGAAALEGATALPVRPLTTCPRGQIWLLLP